MDPQLTQLGLWRTTCTEERLVFIHIYFITCGADRLNLPSIKVRLCDADSHHLSYGEYAEN